MDAMTPLPPKPARPVPDSPPADDLRRRVGVFAAAGALRAMHLLAAQGSYPLFDRLIVDAAGYDEWGRRIAEGAGAPMTVFYQDPFYPYLLGVVYRLLGHAPEAIRWLQVLVGAAACVLISETARKTLGRRAGWAAGLLAAAYGLFIFYDGQLVKESWVVFFAALSLLLLVQTAGTRPEGRSVAETRPARWAAAGLAFGMLTLTRGNAFLFLPVLLTFAGRGDGRPSRVRLLCAAAALAGFLLPLVPTAWHNRAAGGDWVLTTYQGGSNFYIGNRPGASGAYEPLSPGRQDPRFEGADAVRLAEADAGRPLLPSEVSRRWMRRAAREIAADPGGWIGTSLRKAGLLLSPYEIPDAEDLYLARRYSWVLDAPLASYGFVLALALFGVWVFRRDRARLAPLSAFTAVGVLSIGAFYVMARYRLLFVPALLVWAGGAAAHLAEPAGRRDLRRFGLAAAAVAFLAVVLHAPRLEGRPGEVAGSSLLNLADVLLDAGRPNDAEPILREALDRRPGDPDALVKSARLRQAQGRPDEARAFLEEALRRRPGDAPALIQLGYGRQSTGDWTGAATYYAAAATADPLSATARNNLATARLYLGLRREAEDGYRQAVRLDPRLPEARYGLGYAALLEGRTAEAEANLREALRLRPDYADAFNALGVSALSRRDFREARRNFEACVRLAPDNPQFRKNLTLADASSDRR
jgi:tetratricopeptide (TPR) repeat protein